MTFRKHMRNNETILHDSHCWSKDERAACLKVKTEPFLLIFREWCWLKASQSDVMEWEWRQQSDAQREKLKLITQGHAWSTFQASWSCLLHLVSAEGSFERSPSAAFFNLNEIIAKHPCFAPGCETCYKCCQARQHVFDQSWHAVRGEETLGSYNYSACFT